MVEVAAVNYILRPVNGFDAFAAHVREMLDGCAGAHLVVFPELMTLELLSAFPGWPDRGLGDRPNLHCFTDRYLDLFATEAAARETHIVAGSHLVPDAEGELLNVAYLFEPGGAVHRHAKTHVTPVEIELGTGEGDELRTIDLPFGRVGVTLCYEIEMPEFCSALVAQGAQILVCPSYTTSDAGVWRIRHCAQARCVENQVYAVVSCLGGSNGPPVETGMARSAIFAPCDVGWPADGVLADARGGGEAIVRARLDLDALDVTRREGAVRTYADRRRRASLYAGWAAHAGAGT
jgi:predicted amidohydrolase